MSLNLVMFVGGWGIGLGCGVVFMLMLMIRAWGPRP